MTTRIVVFLEGGLVSQVLTDTVGIEVLVIDDDTQGEEDERPVVDKNGEHFDACVDEVVAAVDVEAVQNYYRQAREEVRL